MSVLRTTVFGAVLVLAGGMASGQDTDSQQQAEHLPGPSDAASALFVQQFGLCAARSVPNYSADTLRRLPMSAQANKNLFWVATLSNSCVKKAETLKYAPRYLRGPVAEYLVQRDFELPSWKPKRKPVRLYAEPTAVELEKLDPDVRSAVAMVGVGSCVAKTSPNNAARLMATRAGSAEEGQAFSVLSPSLAACIPPAMQLKVPKYQLRAFIAEGAYRAMAGNQTGAS